jgi:methionyl-tRNA formyltransferase
MGTPEFAVSSLEILIKSGFDVVAVITAPDKPAGRGQKIKQSAGCRGSKGGCIVKKPVQPLVTLPNKKV